MDGTVILFWLVVLALAVTAVVGGLLAVFKHARLLHALEERLRHLERRVRHLQGGTAPEPVESESAPEPPATLFYAPGPPAETPRAPVPPSGVSDLLRGEAAPGRVAEVPKPASAPRRATADWELLLGGNWLNRIGIVAIVVGVIYFVGYAKEAGWLSPAAQIGLAVLGGIALLGFAEYFHRRKFSIFAQGLTGGGLGILYAALFAGFFFYDLYSSWAALGLMSTVTVAGVVLALHHDSQPILVLALIGGFATPALIGEKGEPSTPTAYFTYLLLLDLSVLGIAYFKRWRPTESFALSGTAVLYLGWLSRSYQERFLPHVTVFASAVFLLFLLVVLVSSAARRRGSNAADLYVVLANPALYFGSLYFLLARQHPALTGPLAIALAVVYFASGRTARRLHAADPYLPFALYGLAVTFLTIAIPAQLRGPWITVGWAVEAAALVWLGCRSDSPATRFTGLVIYGFVVARLVAYLPAIPMDAYVFLFNRRVLVLGMAALAAFVMSRAYGQYRPQSERSDFWWLALPVAGHLLLLWIVTAETFVFLQSRFGVHLGDPAAQMAFCVVWGATGTALIGLSASRHSPLRVVGVVLLGATLVTVLSFPRPEAASAFHVLLNLRMAALLTVIAAVAVSGAWFQSRKSRLTPIEAAVTDSDVGQLTTVLAHTLLVWALCLEVWDGFRFAGARRGIDLLPIALTAEYVLWAAYGFGLSMFGARRGWTAVRGSGYVLLAAATVGIALWPPAVYDAAFRLFVNARFLAGVLVVAALFAVSVLAPRWSRRSDEAALRFEAGTAAVFANLVLLGLLTVEVLQFFAARGLHEGRDLHSAGISSVSIVWAAYSVGLLAFGFWRRLHAARYAALGLFGLTIVKVALVDLSALPVLQRILSSIGLGVLLVIASYLYTRYRERLQSAPPDAAPPQA